MPSPLLTLAATRPTPKHRRQLPRDIELRQQTGQVLAQTQIIADAWRERWSSPARRDLLQQSEYARLLARLETMLVIERAKGIIMAQSRCGEAEASHTLAASLPTVQPARA